MAKLVFTALVILFLVSSSSVCNLGLAEGTGKWCVAKPSVDNTILQDNINYVCDILYKEGKKCDDIWKSVCPYATVVSKASILMNHFFQSKDQLPQACDFYVNKIQQKSGIIAITDPSYNNCNFSKN